jgi:hypothetical protein
MASEKNPLVGVAGVWGGVMIAIVAIVVAGAKESVWVLAPIAAAIAAMGVFLGYFASKSKKD